MSRLAPFTAAQSSVLSEDLVATSDILVDATGVSPVAAFTGPDGQSAAVVVTQGRLEHATRSSHGDSGWQTSPVPGGQNAIEVASGVQDGGLVNLFWQDGRHAYRSQLDEQGTWSTPQQLPLFTDIKVAYSFEGTLVAYGRTSDGQLATVHQPRLDSPLWTAAPWPLSTSHP